MIRRGLKFYCYYLSNFSYEHLLSSFIFSLITKENWVKKTILFIVIMLEKISLFFLGFLLSFNNKYDLDKFDSFVINFFPTTPLSKAVCFRFLLTNQANLRQVPKNIFLLEKLIALHLQTPYFRITNA